MTHLCLYQVIFFRLFPINSLVFMKELNVSLHTRTNFSVIPELCNFVFPIIQFVSELVQEGILLSYTSTLCLVDWFGTFPPGPLGHVVVPR